MNLLDAFKNKDHILLEDNRPLCVKCNEEFSSPFDKMYIVVKGACFACDEDRDLANDILNNLSMQGIGDMDEPKRRS